MGYRKKGHKQSQGGRLRCGFLAAVACTSVLLFPDTSSAQQLDTELMEAQEMLVSMVRSRDVRGLASLFLPDGIMVLPDGTTLTGPSGIRGHWEKRWEGATEVNPVREYPRGAMATKFGLVVEGGGYGPDEAGEPIADYARVWQKDDEGKWRVRLFLLTR